MGEARRRGAKAKSPKGPRPAPTIAAKDLRDGEWVLTDPPGEPGMLFALNAGEAASADDREWFEAHPERSHRIRPCIAGEWPPAFADRFTHTAVRQIRRGQRYRLPLWAEGELGKGEAAAAAIFRLLVEQTEATMGRPMPPLREQPAMEDA